MLAFTRKKASPVLESFDSAELLKDLSQEGFFPFLQTFKTELLDRLNLPYDPGYLKLLSNPNLSNTLLGEIFFPAEGVCCFVQITGNSGTGKKVKKTDPDDPFQDPGDELKHTEGSEISITVGELAPLGGSEGDNLQKLIGILGSSLGVDLKWESVKIASTANLSGHMVQTPSERDIELAALLQDTRLEDLFLGFEQNDAIAVEDFLKERNDKEELEYFIDKLLETEFLSEEIVVFCTKTGAPTIRAQDRSALDQLTKAGIKCMCGKALDAENVKRSVVLSDSSREKMKPSWVGEIFLANVLLKVGLSNSDIQRIDFEGNGTLYHSNFDGFPIFFFLANESADQIFVAALEDLVKEFSGVYLVVLSKDKIPTDTAKALVKNPSIKKVISIHEVDEINAKLADLLRDLRLLVASSALAELNSITGFDIGRLAVASLTKQ